MAEEQHTGISRFTVYISYAQQDELLRLELEKHLALLQRQGFISQWHTGKIVAGDNRTHAIHTFLDEASLILLLISPDFLASDECYNVEMTRALERHYDGSARVIPVILRPVDWQTGPFGNLQCLPHNAKAVTGWKTLDDAFLDVAQGLRAAIDDQRRSISARPSSSASPVVWTIPYPRNPFFTGRVNVFEKLAASLRAWQATGSPQLLAISGLGGIGKTQIAVEYAYRFRSSYRFVLWARATSDESLITDFRLLAGSLRLLEESVQDRDKVLASMKEWLTTHGEWLLILDDADDMSTIHSFLPTSGNGHVVFTTHLRATGAAACALEIEGMEKDEGALLLLRRAKILASGASIDQTTWRDRVDAESIVAELNGLPLALDQAGAYIEETACGLSGYLQLYRTRRAELLRERGAFAMGHPASVATTLSLSFRKVEQSNPVAAALMRLCAFLYPERIPEELITQARDVLDSSLQPIAQNSYIFDAVVKELLKYSLIHRDPRLRVLRVHPLVQAVLKDEMSKLMEREWAIRAVEVVSQSFLAPRERTARQPYQSLFQHAQVAANLVRQWDMQFKEATQLLQRVDDDRFAREMIEKIFKQMPPKFAVVLWLYENDGRSYAEIAELLYVSTRVIKSRLTRGRQLFFEAYQHYMSGEKDTGNKREGWIWQTLLGEAHR